MVKFRRLAIAIMAGFGGALLAATCTITFIVKNKAAWWGMVVGAGILFGLLTLVIEDYVIMFCTSFIGSYFLIRGISLYTGGFPYESQI